MRVFVAVLLVVLAASTAYGQSWLIVGADRYFRVEWATTATEGSTTMDGYIYNVSGTAADRMRLLVESLDASGGVTAQTITYLPGVVINNGRTYFRVRVPMAGNYRVRVANYDWIPSGPMQ